LKARAYALKGLSNEIWADKSINTSGITLANTQALYSVFTHTVSCKYGVIFRLRRTVQQNSQTTNLNNGWVSVANKS
jgi:hypothetical protein